MKNHRTVFLAVLTGLVATVGAVSMLAVGPLAHADGHADTTELEAMGVDVETGTVTVHY